ncbi:MAG: hypothetical protein V2A70_04615 [Candidatus Omnitrophota bacterium]
MKRIVVFMAGLMVALLFLEAGLRVEGYVYGAKKTKAVGSSAMLPPGEHPYVILCLGNSYTKGIGSSPGMSYPEQLQRLFDAHRPKENIVVINKGRCVQNTAELLDSLESDLKQFEPDLILLQIGQSNVWNFIKYTDYLKRKIKKNSWVRQVRYAAYDFLYASRVFRLGLLLADNIRQKDRRPVRGRLVSADHRYRSDDAYRQATKFIRKTAIDLSMDPSTKVDVQQCQAALKVLMSVVSMDPGHPSNYVFIGYIYRFQKDYEEALKWFIKGVGVDPEFRTFDEINEGYKEIRDMRSEDKGLANDALNKKIDDFIQVFERDHPQQAVNFSILSKDEILAWVESDILEIVRVIQQHHVALVVQDYPLAIPENEVIMRVVMENNLQFLDYIKIFQDKISGGLKREDLFVPDGHCNDRGYGLMAESLYRKIISAGFITGEK